MLETLSQRKELKLDDYFATADRLLERFLDNHDVVSYLDLSQRLFDKYRSILKPIRSEGQMIQHFVQFGYISKHGIFAWRHEQAHLQVYKNDGIGGTTYVPKKWDGNTQALFMIDTEALKKKYARRPKALLRLMGKALIAPHEVHTGYRTETELGYDLIEAGRIKR